MIKAILFDLDNTLLDRDAMFRKYAYELAEKYAPATVSMEEIAEAAEMLILRDERGYGDHIAMYQNLINQWHLAVTAAEMKQEWVDFIPGGVVVYPNVQRVLAELKKKYRLGVITNGGSPNQWGKINNSGLADLLEVVVVSADVNIEKPDPRIFECALMQMGITADAAIYVGDHLVNDIQGAQSAGLRTIWFQHEDTSCKQYGPYITNVEQLPEVLKQYE